jgi:hypothetical protein
MAIFATLVQKGLNVSTRGDRCLASTVQHLIFHRDSDPICHSDNLGIQQNHRQEEGDTYT